MIGDFQKMSGCRYFGGDYYLFFLGFFITIFQRKAQKKKNKTKKSGIKTTFSFN